jgi:ATP-dependent protease ClpP protease subunit
MKTKNQPKLSWEPPAHVLAAYNPLIRAAKEEEGKTSLNIFSTIGEYGDGMGMTAKIVDAVLRRANGGDIIVNINSMGGDFYEGLAIHSLLSAYEGNVTVRVLALAASAASMVAMAGDKVEIVEAGQFMIHNAWSIAIGNKHDMESAAEQLGKIDDLAIKLYSKKTDKDNKAIAKMMDAETYLDADESTEMGFADSIIGADYIAETEETKTNACLRELDFTLAKAGLTRSKRRELIKSLTGDKPCAVADEPKPCAGLENVGAVERLISKLKN